MTASSTPASDRTAAGQGSRSFPAAATVVAGAVGGGWGILAGPWVGLDIPSILGGPALLSVLGGGLALARAERASVRLESLRWRYLLLSLCVPLLVVALAGLRQGRPPVAAWGALSSGTALLGGWVLATMGRTRYVRVTCGPAKPAVSWEASLPASAKRRRYGLGIAVLLLGTAGLVVGYVLEVTVPVAAAGGAGGALIGSAHQTTTLHAHGVGLEIERLLNRGLFRWDAFESYEVTDDELRLWRAWRPDIRCARAEIDDIDAVTDALDRHFDAR